MRPGAFLALILACSPAAASRPVLTEQEAARKLVSNDGYRSVQDSIEAHFPKEVSTSPVLINSAGPAPVTRQCYVAWRDVFQQLTQQGYLSAFHEIEDRLGIEAVHLTAKGDRFFHPLMQGSIFWMVTVASNALESNLEIVRITRPKGKRAVVEFRSKTSEPFAMMWGKLVFSPECRGELDADVTIDKAGIVGHAHFRFRKNDWRVEKVLLGPHRRKE